MDIYQYMTMTVGGVWVQYTGLPPFDMDYNIWNAYTINSRRSVQAGVVPAAAPRIRYFGMGIEGFYANDSGQGTTPYLPRATNVDLHTPIPFRMVPIDEDISEVERANYRMRSLENVGGNDYWAYWLKVIDYQETVVIATRVTPEGVEEVYVPTAGDLLNEPDSENILATEENSDRIITSFSGVVEITSAEVVEAVNVLYGDINMAKISELGFYSGNDEEVTADDGLGGTITMDESIFTMLVYHRCSNGYDLSDGGTFQRTVTFQDGNLVLRS